MRNPYVKMAYDIMCNFVLISASMTILLTGNISTQHLVVTVMVMYSMTLDAIKDCIKSGVDNETSD